MFVKYAACYWIHMDNDLSAGPVYQRLLYCKWTQDTVRTEKMRPNQWEAFWSDINQLVHLLETNCWQTITPSRNFIWHWFSHSVKCRHRVHGLCMIVKHQTDCIGVHYVHGQWYFPLCQENITMNGWKFDPQLLLSTYLWIKLKCKLLLKPWPWLP